MDAGLEEQSSPEYSFTKKRNVADATGKKARRSCNGWKGDSHVIGGVNSNKLSQAFRFKVRHVVHLEISADLEQRSAPEV